MNDLTTTLAELGSSILELFGIVAIFALAIYSIIRALIDILRRKNGVDIYHKYRHVLARGILFGLELLVAADIIRTVALDLSFNSIGVLALIILIRTFLSVTLNVEASGKWPWQENE
jgi:uncharacterized membrane protein